MTAEEKRGGRGGWNGRRYGCGATAGRGAFASGPLLQEDGGSTELGALERGRGGDGERPAGQL